jgi:rRNA processing protein Gar1
VRGKKILHRMGQVHHVSTTKNIILKAENIPHIGNQAIDEKLKQIGIVFDVFGPTSAPYVAVKPNTQKPEQFINQVLYFTPTQERKNKRRRR